VCLYILGIIRQGCHRVCASFMTCHQHYGSRKLFNPIEARCVICFWKAFVKGFPKHMTHPLFQSLLNNGGLLDGDWKFLVTQGGTSLCYHFRRKKFNPHFPSWVMENFQSPADGVDVLPFDKPPLFNGEWIFSIAKEGCNVGN